MFLSDEDFLIWCENQAGSPEPRTMRCRLAPGDVARLLTLAGLKPVAGLWERAALTHRPGDPGYGFMASDVVKSVRMARSRLGIPPIFTK